MAFAASVYNTVQKIIISGNAFWNYALVEIVQRNELVLFINGGGTQAWGANLQETRGRTESISFGQLALKETSARSETIGFVNNV